MHLRSRTPRQHESHLNDLAGAVQTRARERGVRRCRSLKYSACGCVERALSVLRANPQNLVSAREEGQQAHEASYVQLGHSLFLPSRFGPRVQEVVQLCSKGENGYLC